MQEAVSRSTFSKPYQLPLALHVDKWILLLIATIVIPAKAGIKLVDVIGPQIIMAFRPNP